MANVDVEIINRFQLEEETEMEKEWKDHIATEEYAIYSTKLELICEEAKEAFGFMAISPAVQALDCTAGIYTAKGDLAIASVGTYLHVCTGQIPIKYILKHYLNEPSVGVHDGDVFFCNEAIYGGIHNNDMLCMAPIFFNGEIVAWTVVGGHESETGASNPGGYVPNAKSRYEEGLKVPPVKIAENFRLRVDVLNMFVNMTRDERVMVGDTRAKVACCYKIRDRVLDILEEKGAGFWGGLLRKVVESAAEGARQRVRELNDGTYRCSIFFDIRGDHEGLSCIHVTLKKKDDQIIVDLTDGVSPPTRSYLNTRPHIIRATMLGDLAMYLFPDLPASTGILAPFTILAPENTCVNPPLDTPMAASTRLTPIVVNAIHNCFMKMIYDSPLRDQACAPLGPSGRIIAGGGLDQYGETASWVSTSIVNASGGGARSFADGVNAAGFFYSGFADALDVEHEEAQFALLYLWRSLPRDIGGYGKYRGGHGVSAGALLHQVKSPWTLIFSPYNSRVPIDLGLFGGYAGGMSPCLQVRNGNWAQVLEEADSSIPYSYHDLYCNRPISGDYKANHIMLGDVFQEGDFVGVMGPSGGGYGDVLEHDPSLVAEDLRRGLISEWVATNVYKVVLDPKNGKVDIQATEAVREAERQDRKRRGRPFTEFAKEWLARIPKEELLSTYGPWPWGIGNMGNSRQA